MRTCLRGEIVRQRNQPIDIPREQAARRWPKVVLLAHAVTSFRLSIAQMVATENDCSTLDDHSSMRICHCMSLKRLLVLATFQLCSVVAAARATRRERRGAAGRRQRRHRDARGRGADHRRRRARRSRVGERDADHDLLAGAAGRRASRRRSAPKCASCSPPTRSTSAPCCYDRDPSGIIVSDARRDAPLDDTDSFQIILDTYRDRQNGFVFGTNPAGIEYDGQVTNEGQGGGGLGFGQMQSGGSGARLQHQLGRRVEGAREDHRARLDRRVCDSVPHAALSVGDGADLGHQFPAQHPPPQRARLLGADSAAVQPVSAVARRIDRRRADAGAAQLPHHAVRARQRCSTSGEAPVDAETDLRLRRRPEVQHHAEPDARRHGQHRLRAGRSRRSAGQPRSLHAVLPGEAAVLPRERRLLHASAIPAKSICSSAAASASATAASRFRSSAAAASRARPASSTSAC